MSRNNLHQFQNIGVAELREKNPALIACWRGLIPITERSRIQIFLTGERLRDFQTGKSELWNLYPDTNFTHALRIFYKGRIPFGEGVISQEPRMMLVQVQHRYFDILSVARHGEHPDSVFIFFVKLVANRLNSLDFPGQETIKNIRGYEDISFEPEDCIFRKDLLYLSYCSENSSELKKKEIEMRRKSRLIERVWTRIFEESMKQLVSRGL